MIQPTGMPPARHRSPARRRGIAAVSGWAWVSAYTALMTLVVVAGAAAGHDPVRWIQP